MTPEKPLLTCLRAVMLEYVVTGALASDDPWSGGGKGAALTDKREAGSVGLAEVDDHDGVLSQVHLALDGRPGMHQLGTAEVTNEDRVLKPLAVLLHRLAHPSQSFVSQMSYAMRYRCRAIAS